MSMHCKGLPVPVVSAASRVSAVHKVRKAVASLASPALKPVVW